MTIAVARVTQGGFPHSIVGAFRRTITDITMDDDYTTSGKAVTAAQLGLGTVVNAQAEIKTTSGGGDNITGACAVPQTDGSVLIICNNETPAELSSSADIATTVIRVTAEGYGG